MNEPNLQLTNNTRAGRWEARVDGTLAGFLRYRSVGGRTVLVHTEVDPAFEGRGVGSALARGALEAARADGGRVRVICPFVRSYLRRHPEFADAAEPTSDTAGERDLR